jgi:hypothetical protein
MFVRGRIGNMRFLYLLPLLLLVIFLNHGSANAKNDSVVRIRIHDDKGRDIYSFTPFPDYIGKISFVASDIDGDGSDEIVVGGGFGMAPMVRIFSADGKIRNEFTAYAEGFRGGIEVASCDLNGDGQAEIITGTNEGGGPHVRIFSAEGTLIRQFFAYDESFRGGVKVFCGDVNGDGKMNIVTAPGISGGPHVKIYNNEGTWLQNLFLDNLVSDGGADIVIADSNGNGLTKIIGTTALDGEKYLVFYEWRDGSINLIKSINLGVLENVDLGKYRFDGDDFDSILIASGYEEAGVTIIKKDRAAASFKNFSGRYGSAINELTVEGGKFQVSVSDSGLHRNKLGKHVIVKIGEQKLWSFEDGKMIDTFLISSGRRGAETPRGKTQVTHKLPVHTYRWSYGANDPRNYFIPNVKWNLRFRQHYYLHSATWHNNFGNRMSAGCINIHPTDAERIYNWADVGTTVEIID